MFLLNTSAAAWQVWKMISAGDLYIGTAWLQLKYTTSIYNQAHHRWDSEWITATLRRKWYLEPLLKARSPSLPTIHMWSPCHETLLHTILRPTMYSPNILVHPTLQSRDFYYWFIYEINSSKMGSNFRYSDNLQGLY